MWLTCQAADMHSHTFTGFIYAKEMHFCMTLKLGGQPVWLICVVYKFNLTGGLSIVHFGLNCLLLLLDCLSSDFNVSCITIVHFFFISLVQFQAILCFSIYDTILCSDLVISRFLA